MAFLKVTLGLLAFAVVSVSAQCPTGLLKANSSCNTGSCSTGGLPGTWTIPNIPEIDCGMSSCKYLGVFKLDDELTGTQTVKSSVKANAGACCKQCKKEKKCTYWQWVNVPGPGGVCFRYQGSGPTCSSHKCKSNVGGKCQTGVSGDPHLTGAHGAHFDFSGEPEKAFCLVTDRNLHINMKMTGYLDERTESATVFENGKAVRTWIRQLGIMWTVDGEEHKLRLVARDGSSTERGEGFLALAEMDGVTLPRMQVGDELALEGGLTFKFEAIEKGEYDVDFYTVRIGDLLDVDVRMRVAHPLLQRPEDAEVHISLGVNFIKNTEVIHGVLGQTYRADRAERAEEFNKLVAQRNRHVGADSQEGRGFLDGKPADYMASDVLAADCRYTAYRGHVLPSSVSSE